MHEHELSGLDGGNLLAFLAALGVLRVLNMEADKGAEPALSWRQRGGVWVPILHHPDFTTREELLNALELRCCRHEPTKLRQLMEMADHRSIAHKENSKVLLAEAKGAAKKVLKERLEGEKEVLRKEADEARSIWEQVEAESGTHRKRRDALKKCADEIAERVEKLAKEPPPAPKKTDPEIEDLARAEWQAELTMLRLRAADARREWLGAVAALVPAPAFSLGDNLTVTPEEFSDYAQRAANDAGPEPGNGPTTLPLSAPNSIRRIMASSKIHPSEL